MIRKDEDNTIYSEKREKFLKKMIDKAFRKASRDEKTLDMKEVPDVLRYLNIFPSKYDIAEDIERDLAKEGWTVSIDDFRENVQKQIDLMKQQPADSNTLLVSFEQLDEQKEGQIGMDALKRHMTDKDTEPFQEGPDEKEEEGTRRTEWNTFENQIRYNKWVRDNKFQYEEYIQAMVKENEEHMNKLIEEWHE